MTKDIQYVGIMFDSPSGEREDFPTVRAVARTHTNYLNLYSLGDLVDTFGDWLVVAHDPHCLMYGDDDHEAMDETNFDALLSNLSAQPVSLHDIRLADGSYGPHHETIAEALEIGVAIVQHCLIIAPRNYAEDLDDTGDLDTMADLRARADYPLLDEEAYFEREFDAWQEYAPEAFSDEIRDARKVDDYAAESAINEIEEHAEDILPILAQQLHYESGFSGDYGPKFLVILGNLMRENAPTDEECSLTTTAQDLRKIQALFSYHTREYIKRAF